jgi:hypothetical protein
VEATITYVEYLVGVAVPLALTLAAAALASLLPLISPRTPAPGQFYP